MGFLRRGDRAASEQLARTRALVIEAAAPPEGGPNLGPGSHGPVKILADPGSGSRTFDGKIRMTEEHWLVPGMEIDVIFDPAKPDRFEVDWERVASIEARAAANDPTLAEPIAARRRVAHALGLTQADTGTSRTERFERALEQAGELPAPPNKLRAVVLIATIRGRRRIIGDADNVSTHDSITYERNSAAVLSVNVPRRKPYAVHVQRFKVHADLLEPLWMPLPALVSAADANAVEILWDEVPGREQQLSDRIAGSRAAQQAGVGAGGLSALGAMAPQMQALAVENAKRALQYVQDPAMRKQLIEQYRAAGIDVGEDS